MIKFTCLKFSKKCNLMLHIYKTSCIYRERILYAKVFLNLCWTWWKTNQWSSVRRRNEKFFNIREYFSLFPPYPYSATHLRIFFPNEEYAVITRDPKKMGDCRIKIGNTRKLEWFFNKSFFFSSCAYVR